MLRAGAGSPTQLVECFPSVHRMEPSFPCPAPQKMGVWPTPVLPALGKLGQTDKDKSYQATENFPDQPGSPGLSLTNPKQGWGDGLAWKVLARQTRKA